MFKLAVIIPSKNELVTLKKIVKQLKKKRIFFIVIDDCSTDQTNEYLKKNKFKFIRNNKNIGYTKSILKGINFIRKKNFDYFLTMDADGEHNVNDINKFIKEIKKQPELDIIIADRLFKNRISEKILSFFSFLIFHIKDPLSGFKLYKIKTINKHFLNINQNNFLVDIIFHLQKKNYLISNIEIKNKKIFNRKSRIGNNLIINIKIFLYLRFLFYK